jgi:hypothetical protein
MALCRSLYKGSTLIHHHQVCLHQKHSPFHLQATPSSNTTTKPKIPTPRLSEPKISKEALPIENSAFWKRSLADTVKPRAGPKEFDSDFAWFASTWRIKLGLFDPHSDSNYLPEKEVSAVARASKLFELQPGALRNIPEYIVAFLSGVLLNISPDDLLIF